MLLIYKMVILGNNYLSYEKVHVFKNIFKWVKISIIYKISSSFFFIFFQISDSKPTFQKIIIIIIWIVVKRKTF